MKYPTISEKEISEILKNDLLKKKIERYLFIMNEYTNNGVTDCFKNQFCSFYRLNKRVLSKCNTKDFDCFKNDFFNIIKKDQIDGLCFESIFKKVKCITKRNDISFSSKLLHTINPNMPIWDSVLRNKRNFNIPKPSPDAGKEKVCEKYNEYVRCFNEFKETKDGKTIIKKYNEAFKNNNNFLEISNTKKIDFVLWLVNR